jgi:hypothetical protein
VNNLSHQFTSSTKLSRLPPPPNVNTLQQKKPITPTPKKVYVGNKKRMGIIVGSKGTTIRAIQIKTGCRLTIKGDYVELSGNITQCESAIDIIMSSSSSSSAPPYVKHFFLNRQKIHFYKSFSLLSPSHRLYHFSLSHR